MDLFSFIDLGGATGGSNLNNVICILPHFGNNSIWTHIGYKIVISITEYLCTPGLQSYSGTVSPSSSSLPSSYILHHHDRHGHHHQQHHHRHHHYQQHQHHDHHHRHRHHHHHQQQQQHQNLHIDIIRSHRT